MAFSLTDINDEAIYMVMASTAELRNKNIELIKMLQTMDYHVLIITTNQPYDVLKKNFEKNGISMKEISVVDTVTKYALGHDHEPVSNWNVVAFINQLFITNPFFS